MKNMSVSMKLITGFAIVAGLAVIVGIVGIVGLRTLNNSYTDAIESHAKPLPDIGEAIATLQLMRVDIRNAIYNTGKQAELRSIESSLKSNMADFEKRIDEYSATIAHPKARDVFSAGENAYKTRFSPMVFQILAEAMNNADQTALLGILEENTAATEQMTKDFLDTMDLKMEMLETTSAAGASLANQLLVLLVIILIAAIVLAAVLSIYISGMVAKPLTPLTLFMEKAGTTGDLTLEQKDIEIIGAFSQRKDELGRCIAATALFLKNITDITEGLDTIANGDLTADVTLLSEQDTLGLILQKISNNLNRMFGEVNTSTGQVTSSAKQVADTAASIASSATQMAGGAQFLADGATKQATSVEELSGAIAGIAEKTRTNTSMTDQAAQLARTVIGKAEQGGHQMDEMIAAVNDITEASQSIRSIIETIDSIALQTNLLSLNAAIEAAQAGEHGKGFAVVAEEVRKLAGQSAQAVQETSSVIQDSMQKAELGARVAGEMATSLTEIIDSINENNRLITEIAKASEEQSVSISQINSSIEQVSEIVQQNSATAEESAASAEESAAAAEESAAAADEMTTQSAILEKLISQFRLRNAG
ncbi:MAG: methyl-accepting chemotaxis protein [Peptococcaceae bacterium]|nr:methyl-accepting chemotaxis protein [Peptococcaceae bacterium]